ncbi:MAG: NACHT domain-containing protein [Scytonema hyalinum WJT4-NPBG1]|jgi:predicted NACHT family NTPase|nr:NACHT domain-containing protein [Scytonema hyalinum WJT4-NPBG1]
MPRNIRWDESVKENTLCLVEALLFHADNEFEDEELKTAVDVKWVTENKLRATGFEDKQTSGKRKRTVEVGTKKEHLLKLLQKADKSLKLPKPKDEVSKSLQDRELDEIQTALDCLKQLGVREDEKSDKTHGYWKFTLTLEHQTATPEENLEVVKRKWREHSKTNSLETSQTAQTTDKRIDCQSICHKKLEKPQESARLKCEAPEMGFEVDTLVPQVRERAAADIGYKEQVGTMRMFRINHPVPVTDVYVNLNILNQITSNDLSSFNPDKNSDDNYTWWNLDRQGLGSTKQKEVPALETIRKHRKLMVLGKPGSGKTTLLKSLAIACIDKSLGWNDLDYIPVFIELRKFVEDAAYKKLGHEEFSLCDAIKELFKRWNVAPEDCKRILEEGRALILLDGLDEIPTCHSDFVRWQLNHFCQDYAKNHFIITCRTQSIQYCFDSFTDVEIANFTREQVCKFIHNWFTVMVGDPEAKELEQSLNIQLLLNRPLRELAVTPILLNLICYVFWAKQGDLPTKRSELYDECLKGLLEGEWDKNRGVQRDSELSLDEKEKLLAQVAYTLFENNDYFPRQRKLEELIANYLQTKRSKAKDILELLESQHGLLIRRSTQDFSFSHLTFHEFFTAKYIVSSPNPQEVFQRLVTHITEPRWREVFLLTVEMFDHADNLLQLLQLMRCQIDKFLAGDENRTYATVTSDGAAAPHRAPNN